ncbi:MAG: hypothetical protein L3J82_08685 [Planctomycetes bacterium]|nr:hypothetical protein [Planctomycetota bacterium]
MRRFGFFILALGLLLPVLPAEDLGFRGKPAEFNNLVPQIRNQAPWES